MIISLVVLAVGGGVALIMANAGHSQPMRTDAVSSAASSLAASSQAAAH